MVAVRGNALGVGRVRQYEAAVAGPGRTFAAFVAAVSLVRMESTIAAQGGHAILHGDLDLLRIDAGNIGVDHVTLGLFLDVVQGYPITGLLCASLRAASFA